MALIRPGPMEMAPDYIARKHGRTEIEYMHPKMESILSETYGVTLYQEQVIQISNVLAGFSMAEGDGLRKAMGKKLPKMAKYRDRFVEGCLSNDIPAKLGGEIFDMIERFAGYGFNKAHSAAYAVIAAQTAYMKAGNYPVEFMAALLTTEIGNTEKIVSNVVECRRTGIEVLSACVNHSQVEFSVEPVADDKEAVRFGLKATRNVGENAARAIVEARSRMPDGAFPDLDTFCREVDWNIVSKRITVSGAMRIHDCFGSRSQVIGSLETAIQTGQQHQKASARSQMGLFDMGGPVVLPAPTNQRSGWPEIPQRNLLVWEKELLGVYLSSHPLSELSSGPRGLVAVRLQTWRIVWLAIRFALSAWWPVSDE